MTGGARRIGGAGLHPGAGEVRFQFDGRAYRGQAGDSLASALIANNVRVVARSFKYHRPRGITGIGAEEAAGLLAIERATGDEPNTRATTVELYEGLSARGQNAWPSVNFDLSAWLNLASPLFPVGFYYKTFMAPAGAWMFYEHLIRRVAGLGTVPEAVDTEHYTSTHAHTDVLIAGGGAAGLSAALAAGRSGARVILVDENPWLGLGLLGEDARIDGERASDWAANAVAALSVMDNVRVLTRTTVAGRYEHGFVILCEKVREAPAGTGDPSPRWRLWKVRAGRVVLATGAIERPLVFANNDRPGVMTASAAVGYLLRHGVLPGSRIVVATENDSGHAAGAHLAQAGAQVTVLDRRDTGTAIAAEAGATVEWSSGVLDIKGARGVRAARAATPKGERWLDCDLVAMAGGWSPALHLYAHTGGKPVWDEARGMFVPGVSEDGVICVGASNGSFDLADVLRQGHEAGLAGGSGATSPAPSVEGARSEKASAAFANLSDAGGKAFVDLQGDVTVADLSLAVREGYRSIEHVKRYTTLGMGTDQGKLGNVNGVRAIAEARGEDVSAIGTTRFRPPYVPLPMGAVAAHQSPDLRHPMRRTAAHELHEEAGCVWLHAGAWLRPQFYRQGTETDLEAVNREVMAVRENVSIVDVSTLGKIELGGPDCIEFLNRIYTNGWSTLKVGMGRYGIMLREDGMVFDDGVTMRLAEDHYVMSTTSGGAGAVYEWMTRLLETRWSDLRVVLTPVTEQWFAAALAGPKARDVLARVCDGLDVSNEGLPFMAGRVGTIAGIPARIFRISFSGELSYEINVPADRGAELWQALLEAGAPENMEPYGLESMGVLRLEKGHFVIGREAEGRTNPDDIGLGRMVSSKKWFIGKEALGLPEMTVPNRRQLVGVVPVDPSQRIPYSAHLVLPDRPDEIGGAQGWIASLAYSPTLGHDIALALLEGGHDRIGEALIASAPIAGKKTPVTVVAPHFYDHEGSRQIG